MFDIIPNLLSSIITILFPIFASYKALRTSDPAQLTPWLMYWVVLSCFSLVESWTWFILSWLPFYAYLRLILLSYLVLPQTQGARQLYQTHIHPFLAHYEADIDNLITHAHDRAKAAGLSSLKRFIDFVKENILGLQPKTRSSPSPIREGSYAQNLLSRFNLPSARQGLAAPAGDFYGLLSAALGHAGTTGGSREVQVEEMSRSGTLIPQEIKSAAEKMTFLAAQRERLRMLLTVLDKEASDLSNEEAIEKDVERRLGEPMIEENLKKSRSEAEFEAIEKEEWTGQKNDRGSNEGGVSTWLPWSFWGAKGADKGKSSGVDTER